MKGISEIVVVSKAETSSPVLYSANGTPLVKQTPIGFVATKRRPRC